MIQKVRIIPITVEKIHQKQKELNYSPSLGIKTINRYLQIQKSKSIDLFKT